MAAELIAQFDQDGDGRLGFREFVLVMTHGELDITADQERVSRSTLRQTF